MNQSDLLNLISCEVQFTQTQSNMYMFLFYILIIGCIILIISIFMYLKEVKMYVDEVKKHEKELYERYIEK